MLGLENQFYLTHADRENLFLSTLTIPTFFWSGVVTQICMENIFLPFVDQCHESLGFLLGHLSSASLSSYNIGKEVHTILGTFESGH